MKTLSCPKCGYTFNPKMSLPSTICGKCGTIIPHDPDGYERLRQQIGSAPESKRVLDRVLTRCVKSLPKNAVIDFMVLRKQMIQIVSVELTSVPAVQTVDEYLTEILRREVAGIYIDSIP
jgi:hypothetical protein